MPAARGAWSGARARVPPSDFRRSNPRFAQEALAENAAARELVLSPADLARLAEAVPAEVVTGDRYPYMRTVER